MANKPISQYSELTTIPKNAVFIISRNGIAYGLKASALIKSVEDEVNSNAG